MNSEIQKDLDMVKKHAEALSEHFDTVQIFCTRQESSQGGTVNLNYGSGNWFARYGQVRQWFIKSDEDDKISVRKESEQ